MATTIERLTPPRSARDDRFFLVTAFAMAATIVTGFSLQLGMGRSSFGAPPVVHLHAVVFMGWMVIYVLQTAFAANRSMTLHRRVGWIGAGWAVAMVMMGCVVTVRLVRLGHAPFFFTPLQFLVLDPVSVFAFAGLTAAAIRLRRRTDWHRRLHYCGMSTLLGPALGRLMPMPLLSPYAFEATSAAVMIFPAIGVVHDLRRRGSVHPGFVWGIGTIIATTLLVEVVTYSPAGTTLYRAVTAGSPGASVAPLDFPPPPAAP